MVLDYNSAYAFKNSRSIDRSDQLKVMIKTIIKHVRLVEAQSQFNSLGPNDTMEDKDMYRGVTTMKVKLSHELSMDDRTFNTVNSTVQL